MCTTGARGKTRVERRRFVPRGEGLSSDKSTGLRSLRQTCGRFSVRGPAAWRVDGGTGKKITTGIPECKGLRNRWCRSWEDHKWGKDTKPALPNPPLLHVLVVPGEHTVEAIEKVLLFTKNVWFSRIHDQLGFH